MLLLLTRNSFARSSRETTVFRLYPFSRENIGSPASSSPRGNSLENRKRSLTATLMSRAIYEGSGQTGNSYSRGNVLPSIVRRGARARAILCMRDRLPSWRGIPFPSAPMGMPAKTRRANTDILCIHRRAHTDGMNSHIERAGSSALFAAPLLLTRSRASVLVNRAGKPRISIVSDIRDTGDTARRAVPPSSFASENRCDAGARATIWRPVNFRNSVQTTFMTFPSLREGHRARARPPRYHLFGSVCSEGKEDWGTHNEQSRLMAHACAVRLE